jgi:IS30 family transposase
MSYTHLTKSERFYLEKRIAQGISTSDIAKELGRHKSSLYREINRNTDNSFGFYSGLRAGNIASETKQNSKHRATSMSKLSSECMAFILDSLSKRTSPEQICGRLKREYQVSLSVSILYNYIATDRANGGMLYKCLRHNGKKYKSGSGINKSKIPNRVSIHKRPAVADQKQIPGHWEIDTVYGKDQKSYLLTLTDKATKFQVIRKIPNKESATIYNEMEHIIATTLLPFETITSDNGTEFTLHDDISRVTGATFFFADSYSSWQRGLNEHHNGLIRDFMPKRTDFRNHELTAFRFIENNLNNRPRKSLNYLTPAEAMTNYLMTGSMGL